MTPLFSASLLLSRHSYIFSYNCQWFSGDLEFRASTNTSVCSFIASFSISLPELRHPDRMSKATTSRRELCDRRMKEIFELSSRTAHSVEDKSTFLACYPDVAKIVDDFESSHLKILQDANSDFDKEDQVRALFDRMQYTVKAKYYSLTKPSKVATTNETSSGTSSKGIKLPKITLPIFFLEMSRFGLPLSLYLIPRFITTLDFQISKNINTYCLHFQGTPKRLLAICRLLQNIIRSLTISSTNVIKISGGSPHIIGIH